jgi:lysophospholipase L1-like esterase
MGGAGGAIVMPATGTYPVSSGTPTIYLAGDSTCQTYAANASDQQGWGQRFQEFFNTSDVLVVNKAMGGRSSKSYIDEGRLAEILAVIKPGDYLFAQWGINDRYTSDAARYTNPATTFRTYLKQYIDGARGKNAIPVLLTPTPRHQLSNGLPTNGFPEYCAAIIAVGAETNTPVIDLQSMALAYYTKVGDAYVSSTLILDALHFVSAGAYQMARMVALGVSALNLPISQYVIQSKLAAH